MLELIFPLVLLMKFSKSWSTVQLELLLMSFMFVINYYHIFFMSEPVFMSGMDYISYVMIYLSFWVMSLVVLGSQMAKNLNNLYSSFVIVNLFLL